MTKKLFLSSLFLLLFSTLSIAASIDPAKKDKEPPKDEQKSKVSKEAVEELEPFDGKSGLPTDVIVPLTPYNSGSEEETENAAPEGNSQEIQSFNFLYYIIHEFKFSDFIDQ